MAALSTPAQADDDPDYCPAFEEIELEDLEKYIAGDDPLITQILESCPVTIEGSPDNQCMKVGGFIVACAWADASAGKASDPEDCQGHMLTNAVGLDDHCYIFTESGGGSGLLPGEASTAGHISRTCVWGDVDGSCENDPYSEAMTMGETGTVCFTVVTNVATPFGSITATSTARCE